MSPAGKKRRNAVVPYAIALLGVTVMFFGRLALDPILGSRQPYILFYFVFLFTAWFWGWRPAAFAALVSVVVAFWAFVPPRHSLNPFVRSGGEILALAMAFMLGATIIALIENTRRARTAAERHAEEFRGHFTLSGVGAAQADPQTGRLRRVNAKMLEITGYTEAELLQKTFSEITHADDRDEDMANFRALRSGQLANYQMAKRFLRKDGTITWVEVTVGMLRDGTGLPLHSVAVIQDIHARKQAEESAARREREMRLITDASPVLLVHCDAARRFKFVNRPYAERFGRSVESIVGCGIAEVLGEEAYRPLSAHVDRVIAGEPVEFEVLIPYQGLGPRWMHCSYVPEFDDAAVIGFVGVIIDVAERKQSEEQLRASETRLRTAMDAGKLGAWEWDIAKNHVTWSERLYEFHGVAPGEFDGTVEGFARLVHPEDLPGVQEAIRKSIEEKLPYELEFRAVHPDGTLRWLATSARVIFDREGKPLQMLGGTIDLTKRKESEVALREAKALLAEEARHLDRLVTRRTLELQESLTDMESLCYTIAHDLRAPLRAMQGFARVLSEDYRGQLDETGGEYADRIMKASLRMDGLITDLLAYGRLGIIETALHPIELDTIIDGFLSDYAEEIKTRHATICVERLLPLVVANRTMLEQSVANLVLNAMKFVSGETTPQIRIFAEDCGHTARLCVEDNGIGIASEHQKKLFHVFQRLHTPDKYPGSGIGLAIVKKAAERMKGSVGFHSEPGKGSTFWIELPKCSAVQLQPHTK